MKKILIIYTTNSGSTFAAGEIITDVLSKQHSVTFQNVNESKPDDYIGYDLIILGSPSWKSRGEEGMPTDAMLNFLDVWKTKNISKVPFAIYGCGDAEFAHFCGAVDYLENFVHSAGAKTITDSLRVNSFWFELDNAVEQTKKWAQKLLEVLKK